MNETLKHDESLDGIAWQRVQGIKCIRRHANKFKWSPDVSKLKGLLSGTVGKLTKNGSQDMLERLGGGR